MKFVKGHKTNLGKTWKVKDTSKMHHIAWNNGKKLSIITKQKMSDAKKRNKNNLGKHWKVKDTSKMKSATILSFKNGRVSSAKNRHWKVKDTSKYKGGSKDRHWKLLEEDKLKKKKWQIEHPNRKFRNTKIEQKIAAELTKRRINFQQNIGLCNIANADFYLPDFNIVIECDGCFYHNCLEHYPEYHKDTRKADERKTKLLTENGYNVYHFWGHEINDSVESCINKLRFHNKI